MAALAERIDSDRQKEAFRRMKAERVAPELCQ